jgi:hypothetical protein
MFKTDKADRPNIGYAKTNCRWQYATIEFTSTDVMIEHAQGVATEAFGVFTFTYCTTNNGLFLRPNLPAYIPIVK